VSGWIAMGQNDESISMKHGLWLLVAVCCAQGDARAGDSALPRKSQQEVMSERGYVRYRGSWRTVQEIELIERAERANLARKEWVQKLERLRKQLDAGTSSAIAAGRPGNVAEEIREIADPHAVPAIVAALGQEQVWPVRLLYVEALSHIASGEARMALVATAVDHPDEETRAAATERLAAVAAETAVPPLVAALASSDNARLNRAAEALGRLGRPSAVAPLIAALETQHLTTVGDGPGEGATSATFTPQGGGLAMGGGKKRVKVTMKNDRVLEALVTLTGVNFEWDARAWRAWLAHRKAPAGFDPRRGS
jgi:hypothetical protein